MSLPTEITRLRSGTNTAGGCRIMLVPVDGVDYMPPEVNGAIPPSTPIGLALGYQWTTIVPTRTTQQFAEDWTAQGGARVSRASLEFILPKDRVELIAPLWELRRLRCLVLHFDGNGTVKLMGTKDEPALVTVTDLEHGSGPGQGANQYALRATCTRRRMCPFYLANPLTVVPPPGCPTLAQLVPGALPADLLGMLTGEQADWFTAHYGSAGTPCPTLAQLLATATGPDLWNAITTEQATYIANQVIAIIDGGTEEENEGPPVDGGGDDDPPDDDLEFSALDFSPADFAT